MSLNIPKCRICFEDDNKQSIRAPFVFGGKPEHKFWECANCGSIYLYPIPTIEEEAFFYKNEFEKYMSKRVGDHRDWSNADLHKKTNQDQVNRRIPFMEKYFQPGQKLLEIGCSSGFMLDAFKNYFSLDCVGVEPSGEFSDYVRKSGHEVYESISEISNMKFDIITHFFLFEHMRDPFQFMKDCMSLLNDNGIIIAEIPCANDPLTSLYSFEAFEKFYWSIAHHYYYTKQSLTYVLKKLGYKFKLIPEQRYDISNHLVWMMEGKPGGQKKYNDNLGTDTVTSYRNNLIKTWQCDTIFMYVWK